MTGSRSGAGSDPERLVRSRTHAADLLRGYARRTAPGERSAVTAWYRLAERLDRDTPVRRRFSPVRVLALALGLLVLVKLVPLAPNAAAPKISNVSNVSNVSNGGPAGWSGMEAAGGTEGTGG